MSMRELAQARIVSNYRDKGLHELGISFINFERRCKHLPEVVEDVIESDFDIQKFVDSLEDWELLNVLENQAYEKIEG